MNGLIQLKSIPYRIGWRLAVILLMFNPTQWSAFAWTREVLTVGAWGTEQGLALIVAIICAGLLTYMVSFTREFPVVTLLAAGFCGAVIALGHSPFGFWDITSLTFWKWTVPVVGAILVSAGPAYNIVRRRDAAIIGVDESDHG